tara:strand:+ start:453 stop:881 length:429 start_codon:yes stop_codon:yes gene_type:complete
MTDTLVKKKVDIIPDEDNGQRLLETYQLAKRKRSSKWLKEQVTKESKKKLKLYLEDRLDLKARLLFNELAFQVKFLRSKNPQRTSIDDLIELNKMFHPEDEAYGRIYNKLLKEIILFIKHWDIVQNHTREDYKVRKTWGGVK